MKSGQVLLKASKLSKKFISYKKEAGFIGSLKSLFIRNPITKEAVKQFELEVREGEILGLLGPNGAGKTTLMKMFTGIVVPSEGELTILGHSPWERNKEFRKKIALVMGQKSQLWWDIPAMDSFLLLQKYYEISDLQFKERIEHMSELLGVKEILHVHVRKLSLGERMKLELMASLLHNPELIFLDEPTIGLDLIAQENIRNFVLDYHQKNKCSIIITSHYMADVQALCSRLALIFDGKKAFDGPLSKFENILGHDKNVSFTFENEVSDPFFDSFDPDWNENKTSVELRVPENKFREISLEVLKQFPVSGFHTEKLPIERVMKTLMTNPEILREQQSAQ